MEKAFWDHIITDMNNGNYKSFLSLFNELKELLKILVSHNEIYINIIDDRIIINTNRCNIQDIYNNIIFIYEQIKDLGIPINDNDMDILINKIHNDFNGIKNLDKNKMMLEYVKSSFDLLKDIIMRKNEFITNKEKNKDSE